MLSVNLQTNLFIQIYLLIVFLLKSLARVGIYLQIER